jgi:hypothetical protein
MLKSKCVCFGLSEPQLKVGMLVEVRQEPIESVILVVIS